MKIGIDTIVFYSLAIGLLVLSLIKSREKTRKALKKSWKAFENILPQLIGIMIFVGILLAVLDTEAISAIIGARSGWMGVTIAAVLGGIGSIPGAFVGALIMGQAEALTMGYISTPMRDAVAFTILIIVLLVRPTGIFGEPEKEKA